MDLDRWTPLVFLRPGRYVSRDGFWREFDLREWSDGDYEWTEDPWNGFRDFARRPADTVAGGVGDCEDYALVAASWAVARDRPGVGLGFCWEWPYPWARHVIAYDDECVYSSGDVRRESVGAYVDRSQYDYCVRRPVG